jgi:hypothetical protein
MREHKKSHLGIMGWAMFLAGAMSLGSCSSDETLESMEPKAITFGSVSMENHSRAAADPSYGQTTNPLDQFKVWGTVTGNAGTANIFNGATVTNDYVNDGTKNYGYGQVWSCNQTQYWIPNATYNFMAIANANNGVTLTDGLPSAISYTADGETDLLLGELTAKGVKEVKTDVTASPTTGVTAAKVVDFTMSHLLSKVVFTFTNTDTETALKVKEIKLNGTNTSGTYTLSTGQWNDTNTDYELGFGAEVTIPAGEDGTSEHERLVIPGTYTLVISFKVNDEECIGEEQEIDATIENQTFTDGHSYNITANIKSGMKEIIFNVTSAAWGGTNDEGVTVN